MQCIWNKCKTSIWKILHFQMLILYTMPYFTDFYSVFVLHETKAQLLIRTFMKKIISHFLGAQISAIPWHSWSLIVKYICNFSYTLITFEISFYKLCVCPKTLWLHKKITSGKTNTALGIVKKKDLPHKHALYTHRRQALITFKQIRRIISSSTTLAGSQFELCFYQIRFQRHNAATERLCDHNS